MKEVGYKKLNLTAKSRQWETDLRKLVSCNFHQPFEYLVIRTRKYGKAEMKGVSYKKIKSYQFFKEGYIKSYEIAKGFGKMWVKSKVMASMKHEIYSIIAVFDENSDVLFAACESPAG